MEPHDPLEVAETLLRFADDSGSPVTPMQLIKMAYIAHGWHLVITGRPLIAEPVQAWEYGPVVRSIYHAFKQFRSSPIKRAAGDPTVEDIISPGESYDILQRVWNKYHRFTGNQLSAMTHQPGSPWDQARKQMGPTLRKHFPIDNAIIERHYRNLAGKSGGSVL